MSAALSTADGLLLLVAVLATAVGLLVGVPYRIPSGAEAYAELEAILDALDAADPRSPDSPDMRAERDLRRMPLAREWLDLPRLTSDRKVALILAGIEPAHARDRATRKLRKSELETLAALRGVVA